MTSSPDDSIAIESFAPDRPTSFDVERDDRASEKALAVGYVDGWCNICGRRARFIVSSSVFRENLICPHDACIGRHRAIAVALAHEYFGEPDRGLHEVIHALARLRKSVYLTETNTSLYRRFEVLMPPDLLVVSEFFGDDLEPGERVAGVRHENLEHTSFQDAAFDLIITSEVMEHVPDALQAEREIVRLLRPGSLYAFTVPLHPYAIDDTILALKRPDGSIVHFVEPVYHGDPRREGGILAYRIFAANALDRRFRNLGCSFTTYRVWSQTYGILGRDEWVHVVRKANAAE